MQPRRTAFSRAEDNCRAGKIRVDQCLFSGYEPPRFEGSTSDYRFPMVSDPHSFPIQVDPADIDFMGHVNNATYLKWVQAAVVDHWRERAPRDAVDAYAWVAVKHEITYRKPAFLTDTLVAVVQLEGVKRESAFYDTVFRRGAEVIAEAKSRWCCLCAETLQPARVPEQVVEKFLKEGAKPPPLPVRGMAHVKLPQ